MVSKPLPKADLDHVLAHTEEVWRELRGARLFVSGGTGFFGKWLLETIVAANDVLDAKLHATVLSRSPQAFARHMPHLAERRELAWISGDIIDFEFPTQQFTHLIHLATPASAALNDSDPRLMLSTIVDGTRRMLDFARLSDAKRLLLASSGAVYGPQPPTMSHIREDYLGGPDPLSPGSAYAEGKRMAELLCALTPEVECVIARCFAFIGPHLPLDAHFAAGNFLRDALAGGPIILKGDGRSVRSYLHAADLTIWLLALLARGQAGRAYNVGSDQAVTTLELAQRIAALTPGRPEIRVLGTPSAGPAHRYVPAIARSNDELSLKPLIGFESAIKRALSWLTVLPQ